MLYTVFEKQGGVFGNIMQNDVNPFIHNVFQSGTQAITGGIENTAKGVMNNVMPKLAPWLMLPIAMGLMGNMGQGGQQPQGMQNPQYNPIQPNNYAPQYTPPQGFKTSVASVQSDFGNALQRRIELYKQSGAGTTAVVIGAIHKKLVSNAIDKITEKKDEQQTAQPPLHIITAGNSKTERLMESPKVKSYVENLITN